MPVLSVCYRANNLLVVAAKPEGWPWSAIEKGETSTLRGFYYAVADIDVPQVLYDRFIAEVGDVSRTYRLNNATNPTVLIEIPEAAREGYLNDRGQG